MRFGAWQVIGKPQKDDGAWKALCQCACGTIRFVLVSNLLRGLSRSCGCASRRANSRRAEDLTGRRFGTLVVKGQAQQKIHDRNAWICQCDCGAICVVPGKALKSGHRKSCGAPAHRLERGMLQLAGKRIGNLTVLEPTNRRSRKGSVIWECVCDCGTQCEYSADELIHGNIVSCGCQKAKAQAEIPTKLHFISGTCIEWLEKRKHRCDNTSGFRGVSRTRNGKWRVSIGLQGVSHYLGTFTDFDEAVKARLSGEERFHGAFLEKYYKALPDEDLRKDKDHNGK